MPRKPTPTPKPHDVPNPGSDAALDQGCLCPVLDNGHGRGSMYGSGVFVITGGCPLHAPQKGARHG